MTCDRAPMPQTPWAYTLPEFLRMERQQLKDDLADLSLFLAESSDRARYLALNRLRHHLEDALREVESLQLAPLPPPSLSKEETSAYALRPDEERTE